LPAGLTAAQVGIALAVALPSAFIRGLSGFGLALMLVPVLALTVTPEQAVVTANLLGLAMGFASMGTARQHAERSAWPIAALAVALTPVGLALLAITPADAARLVIALVAVAAFTVVMLPKPVEPRGQGPALTGATGISCGLLAGFAGMPGPPVIAFYLGRRVAPGTARASMFLIFFATSIAACISAMIMGLADATALWLAALLAPAVLAGNWLGGRAFGRVNALVWRIVAGGIVGGSALVALARVL
jgi:uncharacterized membrane protein YfcA